MAQNPDEPYNIQNHIPKFASASSLATDNSNSALALISLDEIFADHFFPEEIDFTDFFNVENVMFGESGSIVDIRPSMFDTTSTASISDFGLQANPATTSSSAGNHENADQSTPVNIYPFQPQSGHDTTSNHSSVKTDEDDGRIKRVLAMNKYNRPVRKLPSPPSHPDSDSDDDYIDHPTRARSTRKRKGKLAGSSAEDHVTVGEGQPGETKVRVERRERNREHAKKSRVRKKMMLDTLADQLTALRDENVNLRRVVAERIPHLAPKILNDCTTVESGLLSSTSELNFASRSSAAQQPRQYAKILMEPDFRLIQALLHSQQNFVLSDPSLPDNPIVYASDGFCKLSGYKRQDILGRNCRFLQGPGTDPKAVDMIRKGISEGRDISVCLLNYRADGTPFWNQFFVAALRDAEGNVVNFVGIQCAVNSLPVSDIKERVKKLPIPVGI